jgi:hypothetical protein
MNCQIEFVSSDSDNGMPCGKPGVTKCADCGVAICSDCRMECCGHSFCELCYDYHAAHACVKKPVQSESNSIPTFRPAPAKLEIYLTNGAQKGADHIPKTDFTGT